MFRKHFKPEQIITILRQIEAEQSQGKPIADSCKKACITEQTFYRWRKEYGGLKVNQAKRLKELEKENTRLKKLVADQAVDMSILKEVASGKF